MRLILLALSLFVFLGASQVLAGEQNLYNPYMNERLPSQGLSNEDLEMAKSMGAKKSSLQDEAGHRKFWRQELYPIVFGNSMANNEVIVFIDYASQNSEIVWAQVLEAAKAISPQENKIVVFAKNSEQYGTELMGGGIWVAHSRPSYAMDYFTYSLRRWNEAKRALSAKGINRNFKYEYDATANKKDFPILYSYLTLIKPQVSDAEHKFIAQYAFDAGNVNLYQAVMAAKEYDVEKFPAVVVNGDALDKVSAQNIIEALR